MLFISLFSPLISNKVAAAAGQVCVDQWNATLWRNGEKKRRGRRVLENTVRYIRPFGNRLLETIRMARDDKEKYKIKSPSFPDDQLRWFLPGNTETIQNLNKKKRIIQLSLFWKNFHQTVEFTFLFLEIKYKIPLVDVVIFSRLE